MRILVMIVSMLLVPGLAIARDLSPSEIISIIGYPPAKGSIEETKDFDTLLQVQKNRTSEECDYAASQERISLESFFVAHNGPLKSYEANKLNTRFTNIYRETSASSSTAKKLFNRPRPYLVDQDLSPCISRVNSAAYPSGHAMAARIFARLLSKIYPERKNEFMQRADEVAFNRVLGGVHHPTDIEAGKKLGDVLAEELVDEFEDSH